MISSKKDYEYYKDMDKIALGKKYKHPHFVGDEIWKFELLLRKAEYYNNCSNNFFKRIYGKYIQYKYYKKRLKYGVYIPLNVFGPGLSIAHLCSIVINGNSVVGNNCRIHENVTIGSTNSSSKAPILGNNIFIGSGAKIIGDIKVLDNTAIGAGAVVVKSFNESDITIGGIPAKKISNNNSYSNLNKELLNIISGD